MQEPSATDTRKRPWPFESEECFPTDKRQEHEAFSVSQTWCSEPVIAIDDLDVPDVWPEFDPMQFELPHEDIVSATSSGPYSQTAQHLFIQSEHAFSPIGEVSTDSTTPITTETNPSESALVSVAEEAQGTYNEVALEVNQTVNTGFVETEACFGMICDVKVQLRWKPETSLLTFVESPIEGQYFLTLQLAFKDDYCILQAQSENDVAILNKKLFPTLTSLRRFRLVHFEAFLSKDEWMEKSSALDTGLKSALMTVDIVMYGPQQQSDAIAKELSGAGLFLQHPHIRPDPIPYVNPQYLDLSGLDTFEDLDLTGFCGYQNNTTEHQSQTPEMDDCLLNIDDIIDMLPQHDYLSQIATDTKIVTPLLAHQKEAVDFVIRRETGNSPKSRSLWEQHKPVSGSSYFQHIITGAKSRTAGDIPGGILADDMGLGKSLTMLSAIVGTLDAANTYAWSGLTGSLSDPGTKKMAKSTLIVVPSALLLDGWAEEIDRHVIPGSLRYYKYHGQTRRTEYSSLLSHDIVLTTYGTLSAEFGRRDSMLDHVNWYRIILDEAHVIRNRSTRQFKAVSNISANIRWCLSGTPIQNAIEDLGALVKFLKVPELEDGPTFRKHIACKIRSTKTGSKSDFANLQTLLGSICLRRNKNVLHLFGSTTDNKRLDFSTTERKEYSRLETTCKKALDLAVNGHKTKEAHQSVLEALLRLRLFCNNGPVIEKPHMPFDPEEVLSCLDMDGEAVCGYCSCDVLSLSAQSESFSPVVTPCRRVVCSECRTGYQTDVEKNRNKTEFQCPLCHDHHNWHGSTNGLEGNASLNNAVRTYPTKMLALLEDIQRYINTDKSVIFSFWRKTLDIVEDLFSANGVQYLRIDGSLLLSQRKKILLDFQTRKSAKVLLMTLGTGSVGLNSLSVANRLHILEPQWNPSVESQAIGRVLRLGQENPVTVIRYIIKNTVERSVQNRQLRKINLAAGGFSGGKGDQAKHRAQWQQIMSLLCPESDP